jgi:hypothetical protein
LTGRAGDQRGFSTSVIHALWIRLAVAASAALRRNSGLLRQSCLAHIQNAG